MPSPIPLDRLPRIPPSLARGLRHVGDSDVSPDALRGLFLVERDLEQSLIRAANLPLFGAKAEVRSVPQAIACLGREGFQDLLFTFAALHLFRDGMAGVDAPALKLHALACGILAREIARRSGAAHPCAAYRAGLVHDIGVIALAVGAGKAFSAAARMAREGAGPLLELETSIVGTDHARAGLLYAEELGLPADVRDPIRFHHHPEDAPRPRVLTAVVSLADHLASLAGLGNGLAEIPAAGVLESHPAWILLIEERPGLRLEDLRLLSQELPSVLTPAREAVLEVFGETVTA